MLVPDVKTVKDFSRVKTNILDLGDDFTPNGTIYNVEALLDEKELDKFIKKIEKMVRSSYEYKLYIYTLKTVLNYTTCTFIPKIDINEIKGVPIEFHHYPFTLYDLVSIEVNSLIEKEVTELNPFEITDKIIKLHFQNLVGLVPLLETVHELVHDGKKFINTKYVKGDYKAYLEKFSKKIPEEFKDKVQNLEYLSKQEDEGVDIDGNILDIKILNVINTIDFADIDFLELREDEIPTKEALNGEYDSELIEEMESVGNVINLEELTEKKSKKKKPKMIEDKKSSKKKSKKRA